VRYRFGEFVLDVGTRQLLREGRVLPFGPKALELLELLLRSRPKAVSRTRLRAAIWPATHVGATSLHVLVSQVRAALGDAAAEPRFIRTVDRFGYAFSGEAEEEDPAGGAARGPRACVRLVGKRQELALGPGEHILGREEGTAGHVDGSGVSRQHARLVVTDDGATLEDLGSKNGTFVGEERLLSPRTLQDGDVLRLGRAVSFVFHPATADDTRTEEPD
jgi:DNA-binding winged helix-turn-helix (wHTH) protein